MSGGDTLIRVVDRLENAGEASLKLGDGYLDQLAECAGWGLTAVEGDQLGDAFCVSL